MALQRVCTLPNRKIRKALHDGGITWTHHGHCYRLYLRGRLIGQVLHTDTGWHNGDGVWYKRAVDAMGALALRLGVDIETDA